jgi:threonine dehydrogenase-like Zn-dependent dehydrogenase
MAAARIAKKGRLHFAPVSTRTSPPHHLTSFRGTCCTQKLTLNSGFAGGAYGYVAMGPYQGGQAQFLRVPFADFNCLPLPAGTENESDFILLADIFPTGWHGLQISGFRPGESVAVFGCGPVGLMAAYSAVLRGASKVYAVDSVKERLVAAEKIGCIPIDFLKSDAVDAIIKHNGGMVDRSVDAVGYQASAQDGKKEAPSVVLENCIKVTRPTGGIGVPGLYVPSDPGAPDSNSSHGMLLISFGKLFEKVYCHPYVPDPELTSTPGSHNWNGPMQRQGLQPLP